jgi:hypothetical protein
MIGHSATEAGVVAAVDPLVEKMVSLLAAEVNQAEVADHQAHSAPLKNVIANKKSIYTLLTKTMITINHGFFDHLMRNIWK